MVGNIALLQNDSTKRVLWKLALVKELLPGLDGRIRAAVVQVAGSRNLLKRSVKHLIPIEVRSNIDEFTSPGSTEPPDSSHRPVTAVNRPCRRAAIDGELFQRLKS